MAIGLSTYAFFWRISTRVDKPLTVDEMLEQTADMGGKVFQICDYPLIESMTNTQLDKIRQKAESLSITLELGTKGITSVHLITYLQLAKQLNVKVIRSMFNSPSHKPTLSEATELLSHIMPKFAADNVKLCIETYEQVSTANILSVINKIDHPLLGICLDPANCVAALEYPKEVIDSTASRVLNLHVKDFSFTRKDGWVGFSLAGCPLGTGLLDYDYMISKVKPKERGINQIIEHWLPWQDNAKTTCQLEDEWTRHNMNFLKNK